MASGANYSRPPNNVTLSSQGKETGNHAELAKMLHEKQYTPDLKQSDLRLNSSNKKLNIEAQHHRQAALQSSNNYQRSTESQERPQNGNTRRNLNGLYKKSKKMVIAQKVGLSDKKHSLAVVKQDSFEGTRQVSETGEYYTTSAAKGTQMQSARIKNEKQNLCVAAETSNNCSNVDTESVKRSGYILAQGPISDSETSKKRSSEQPMQKVQKHAKKEESGELGQVLTRMKTVLQQYKHTTTVLQDKCNG